MGETPRDKQQSGSSNQKEISRRMRFQEWLKGRTLFDALMVVFTAVIAFSTFVYMLYAKRQWEVMGEQLKVANKSTEIASKTLVASERAWVLLDSVDLKRTLRSPDGKRAAYQVIFRNFGKGLATDVSICAEVTAALPNWKSYNCDIHTEIVAPPGGEVPIVVTGPAFPDVVKQVYIWGAVKYSDQFGIARYTEYCTTPHMTLNNTVAVGPCDHTRAK
jgi:hypothetical protein